VSIKGFFRRRDVLTTFAIVLFALSAIELYSHYTGVWSPLRFHQSTFDGDSALAIVAVAVSLMMVYPGKASVDFVALISFLASWKIATKFYPRFVVLSSAPDILWCLYLIFCAVVLALGSRPVELRPGDQAPRPAPPPTRAGRALPSDAGARHQELCARLEVTSASCRVDPSDC
jgi:hypothetical protein